MNIELHTAGLKLPPVQARDLRQRLRDALQDSGVRLVRVFLKVAAATMRRTVARECVVEVHLNDGRVAYVTERQRHLGALMRRVVARALSTVRAVSPPAYACRR